MSKGWQVEILPRNRTSLPEAWKQDSEGGVQENTKHWVFLELSVRDGTWKEMRRAKATETKLRKVLASLSSLGFIMKATGECETEEI